MITWKIWSALQHPPARHPIFRRVMETRAGFGGWRVVLIVAIGLAFLYGGYQISFVQSPVRLIVLSLTLQDVLVLFVGFNLTYGCLLAWGVSQTVARAREQQIYDTLCLTPGGTAGVLWAIGAGAIYHKRGFMWFRFAILLISAIPIIALGLQLVIPLMLWGYSTLTNTVDPSVAPTYLRMIEDLLYGVTLVAAFYTSCVQSVVMGLLLGILTPESVGTSSGQVWTVGIFLVLQVVTFVLALFFSLFALPAIYSLFSVNTGLATLSAPILRLAFFFFLRESINLLLWRAVTGELRGEWRTSLASHTL